MRAFLAVVILGCLVGCSTTQSSGGGKMLRYPDRSLADWQPDKAVAEARRDIAAGTAKIYISGTIVAFAPGISTKEYHNPEESQILKILPSADAGIGCVIEDMELRKTQFEYARRYNEYVIQHLPKR